jgi:hypothetical protein
MIPESSWEADFNDWYDQEHIPVRMAVPGFLSAQRYRAPDSRHYLAIYELQALAVLATPAYQQVKAAASARTRRMLHDVQGFTRYLAEPIATHTRLGDPDAALDAPYVFAVCFAVPPARQPEFNAWYADDHVPILLECPDWLCVRRFAIRDGEPATWTHLTLHYLADTRALESSERARARATPWRARLAEEHWFGAGSYRLFEKHGPRQRGRG